MHILKKNGSRDRVSQKTKIAIKIYKICFKFQKLILES